MFSLDMNKHLWRDNDLFESFHYQILKMNKAVSDQNWDPLVFLGCANNLDKIMQEYEEQHGSIEDPIFYWSFATANALFLLIGKSYDFLGPTRISYVLNGYREGLNKHKKYPSYPAIYIEKAFEHMAPFAEGEDEKWINDNRHSFVPIQD
jgi:hypothetical protein